MTNQNNKAIVNQAEVNYKKHYFDPKHPHPGEVLLETLDYCFQAGIDVPQWAKDAYRKCYKKYGERLGEEPLVMAFDTDLGAGLRRDMQHRKKKHFNTVFHTLWHLHSNEEWPLSDELFIEVAERHGNIKGLSAGTVEAWYKSLRPMIKKMGGFPVYHEFVKPKK